MRRIEKENTMNKIEQFLEDISFNTKYTFLDMAKDKTEIEKVAKKCRLKLPARDIAIFKALYAYVDRQNLNGCTLPKEEVEKSLDTLVGKAVDFDHLRQRICGHFIDAFIEGDKIIAYGVFFKGNLGNDYKDIKDLMEKDKLGISFEAYGTRKMKENNTYDLEDLEFAGGGLLLKESPAFEGAEVLEMSKERVLEFASTMTKPDSFIRSEETLEQAYSCTCIACGHKMNSGDTHCKDLVCEKCGGQMRRSERPGPGKASLDELPESARYYVWDMESIMKALSSVECPSCKEKGMYQLDMIDFMANEARIKCVCDAILKADLTPAIKVQKKGREIKTISQVKKAMVEVVVEEDIKNLLESIKIEKSNRNV